MSIVELVYSCNSGSDLNGGTRRCTTVDSDDGMSMVASLDSGDSIFCPGHSAGCCDYMGQVRHLPI